MSIFFVKFEEKITVERGILLTVGVSASRCYRHWEERRIFMIWAMFFLLEAATFQDIHFRSLCVMVTNRTVS
jgi:hypothetical protein